MLDTTIPKHLSRILQPRNILNLESALKTYIEKTCIYLKGQILDNPNMVVPRFITMPLSNIGMDEVNSNLFLVPDNFSSILEVMLLENQMQMSNIFASDKDEFINIQQAYDHLKFISDTYAANTDWFNIVFISTIFFNMLASNTPGTGGEFNSNISIALSLLSLYAISISGITEAENKKYHAKYFKRIKKCKTQKDLSDILLISPTRSSEIMGVATGDVVGWDFEINTIPMILFDLAQPDSEIVQFNSEDQQLTSPMIVPKTFRKHLLKLWVQDKHWVSRVLCTGSSSDTKKMRKSVDKIKNIFRHNDTPLPDKILQIIKILQGIL